MIAKSPGYTSQRRHRSLQQARPTDLIPAGSELWVWLLVRHLLNQPLRPAVDALTVDECRYMKGFIEWMGEVLQEVARWGKEPQRWSPRAFRAAHRLARRTGTKICFDREHNHEHPTTHWALPNGRAYILVVRGPRDMDGLVGFPLEQLPEFSRQAGQIGADIGVVFRGQEDPGA